MDAMNVLCLSRGRSSRCGVPDRARYWQPVTSTTLGTYLSFALHRAPGSMIVLVAAGFFVLSLPRGVVQGSGIGTNASK